MPSNKTVHNKKIYVWTFEQNVIRIEEIHYLQFVKRTRSGQLSYKTICSYPCWQKYFYYFHFVIFELPPFVISFRFKKSLMNATFKFVWCQARIKMSYIIEGIKDFYNVLPGILPERIVEVPVERILIKESTMILGGQSRNFVRLAGLSGAIAVGMSAYGAHGEYISVKLVLVK